VFVALGLFFSKLAVATFGGAYAILAYMAQAAAGGGIANLALWIALYFWFRGFAATDVAGWRAELPVLASLDPAALLLSVLAALALLRFNWGWSRSKLGAPFWGVFTNSRFERIHAHVCYRWW
jgi:hypothetical protein